MCSGCSRRFVSRLCSWSSSSPSSRLQRANPGANGVMLSADAQANLFTPYFSTKPNGQGIGLTLVQEILVAHGCDFTLESEPGGPTRFTIVCQKAA